MTKGKHYKANQRSKKYRDEFCKNTYTQMDFKLNTEKDSDLIDYLKSQRNRTQILREAIEKYRKGQ